MSFIYIIEIIFGCIVLTGLFFGIQTFMVLLILKLTVLKYMSWWLVFTPLIVWVVSASIKIAYSKEI